MKTSPTLPCTPWHCRTRKDGSAIVITLSILVLVTVLAVGLFSVLMTERITSSSAMEIERARALNQLAADHAVSLIRQATTGTTGKFWSSQPGAITVFNANGTVASTTLLYSGAAVPAAGVDAAELNPTSFSGKNPIASVNSVVDFTDPNGTGATPPASAPSLKAPWVNVLKDPTSAASASNPIIGRYAFWVDDESAKFNINTADGTVKNTAASFGAGTPAEMSLGALKYMPDGNTDVTCVDDPVTPIPGLSGTIANRTGMRPVPGVTTPGKLFNDPSEILQVPGAVVDPARPTALYDDNNFSLTTYNRAPELNIFGEPKMYLMVTATNTKASVFANTHLPLNAMLGAYAYNGLETFPNPYFTAPTTGTSGPVAPGTPLGFASQSIPPDINSISLLVNGQNGTVVADGLVDPTNAAVSPVSITQVYPVTSSQAAAKTSDGQLPKYSVTGLYAGALPQYFTDPGASDYLTPSNSTGNPILYRFVNYLKGFDSNGNTITWPQFPGSDPSFKNFRDKYTDLQIDSIALQLQDFMTGVFQDHYRKHHLFSKVTSAFLTSGTQVIGQSNLPHINQVVLKITTIDKSAVSSTISVRDQIKMDIYVQWYFPKEYKGENDHVAPFDGGSTAQWAYGCGGNQGFWLNRQDAPRTSQEPSGSSFANILWNWNPPNGNPNVAQGPLGGWWMDNMLRVADSTGASVLDLFSHIPNQVDPNQPGAKYCGHSILTGTNKYLGGGIQDITKANQPDFEPILEMVNFTSSNIYKVVATGSYNGGWRPGYYVCTRNTHAGIPYNMKPGLGASGGINLTGGLAIWTHFESSSAPIDVVPLDSLHGTLNSYGYNTNVTPASLGGIGSPTLNDVTTDPLNGNMIMPTDPMRQRILDAVIPISPDGNPVHINVNGVTEKYIVMWVDDPVVNKFPGDWHVKVSDTLPPEATLLIYSGNYPVMYRARLTDDPKPFPVPGPVLTEAPNGPPPGFLGSNGGDPSGYWWPEQSTKIPKSQRFPSIGCLQYIHTGIFPDKKTEIAAAGDVKKLHGTPFRLLNFGPSYDPASYDPTNPATATGNPSQKTDGGLCYPDWAMLDLFTVPAAFQPMDPSNPLVVSNCAPPIQLTWGGATTGRLNPNSPILPFSADPANPAPFSRTMPLTGILKNLPTSTSYDNLNNQVITPLNDITGDTTQDPTAIALAIDKYLTQLGRPLMMPAEICNVPVVANFVYQSHGTSAIPRPSGAPYNSASRNDVVRQIVGNLSTRSNTFTVWSVAQTLDKRSKPAAECRMKYVVERYLDYGVDATPGNSVSPGPDGIVGTPDDIVDPTNHPSFKQYPLPYKYRILSATPVNN